MTINKRTADGFVTVITSPVVRYEVFREHGTIRGVVAPVVHLAASEMTFYSQSFYSESTNLRFSITRACGYCISSI